MKQDNLPKNIFDSNTVRLYIYMINFGYNIPWFIFAIKIMNTEYIQINKKEKNMDTIF
jgi:hypothetical protein